MTKIRKMSRIPAEIENIPNVVNIDMKTLPAWSASSSASAFDVEVSSPSGVTTGFSVLTTWSESWTAASPLPRFEIAIPLIRPGLSNSVCAWASGTSSAASAVVVPSNRTTSRTRMPTLFGPT